MRLRFEFVQIKTEKVYIKIIQFMQFILIFVNVKNVLVIEDTTVSTLK
jgi:hypothetical protein